MRALYLILVVLLFSCKKEEIKPPVVDPKPLSESVIDIDGNVYHTVVIGTQTWMVENLKVIHYNDGSPIELVTDSIEWVNKNSAAFCWYRNNKTLYESYGALYNWYAVDTGKLCPVGWHIPSDAEWATLISYLGGDLSAGGKLKEMGTAHWLSPNTGATNQSGFTALPGGRREFLNGSFSMKGTHTYMWSTTLNEDDPSMAWVAYITSNYGYAYRDKFYDRHYGLSVRCIKD